MQKALNINLLARGNFTSLDEFRKYEKMMSGRENIAHFGERERLSLYALVKTLTSLDIKAFDNFYFGYSIPKIGKEFDLLKFSDKFILNIELKSENVGLERIKAQLVLNERYLKYLNIPLRLYTYVMSEDEFYSLRNNELITVEKWLVKDVILAMKYASEINIDDLFKACDYLVSPLNDVEKFLNGRYFLTTHQDFIKKEILKKLDQNYFKISGESGCGKTLLLYDLATLLAERYQVLIISVNNITEELKMIDDNFANIRIARIDDLSKVNEDIILVDNSQRMTLMDFRHIISLKKKIFFFIDPKQVFTVDEYNNRIDKLINSLNSLTFKLTNNIRINNNIYYFVQSLFDRKFKLKSFDNQSMEVVYAANPEELKAIIKYYELNGYQLAYYPKNRNFQGLNGDLVKTIGIIDQDFYYDNLVLKTKNHKNLIKENYLYQLLMKTKEKAILVCYRNKTIFREILRNLGGE